VDLSWWYAYWYGISSSFLSIIAWLHTIIHKILGATELGLMLPARSSWSTLWTCMGNFWVFLGLRDFTRLMDIHYKIVFWYHSFSCRLTPWLRFGYAIDVQLWLHYISTTLCIYFSTIQPYSSNYYTEHDWTQIYYKNVQRTCICFQMYHSYTCSI